MRMHNPPHPGEVLKSLCLEPLGLTVTGAAGALGVSRRTLSAIVKRPLGDQSRDGGSAVAGVRHHGGELACSAGAVRPLAGRKEARLAARQTTLGCLACARFEGKAGAAALVTGGGVLPARACPWGSRL
jgi:hypothetical protein